MSVYFLLLARVLSHAPSQEFLGITNLDLDTINCFPKDGATDRFYPAEKETIDNARLP
jgi:hypothetical protein